MKTELVSIIIPMYNAEEHIIECLSSIDRQIYSNLEVLIINDGSTDKSIQKVKYFIDNLKKSDINYIIFNKDNSGVSSSRNKGIDLAQGEYIIFMDSDDSITNNHVSHLIDLNKKYNTKISITGIKQENENNRPITNKLDRQKCLRLFLNRKIKPGVWSLCINKRVIKENKLRFSEDVYYSEDVEFIYKLFNNVDYIALSNKGTYLYNVHDSSVMSKVDDKRISGFKAMINLESYFEQTNPEFYNYYKKYGVSRWVFSTLWQMAASSINFNSFRVMYKKYNSKKYVFKLVTFPSVRVIILSLLFTISSRLYYVIINRNFNKWTKRNFKKS